MVPCDLTFFQMVERTQTTGSRGIRKRSSKFLAPEQVPRFHCDFCSRDISRKIRIKCAECNDFDLCVECFAVGVESQDHKKTHRYRVIDDQSFAVFSSSWGADEELLFFDGICDFGISNWEAIAGFIGSKSPEACKQHYMELLEKQHWLDDEPPLPEPLTTRDVMDTALPFKIEHGEFGSSPRPVSPASSLDMSLSDASIDVASYDDAGIESNDLFDTNQASEMDGTFTEMEIDTQEEETKDTPETADHEPSPGHHQNEENGHLDDWTHRQNGSRKLEPSSTEHGHPERDDNGESKRLPPGMSASSFPRPVTSQPTTTPGGRSGRSLSYDVNAANVTGYNRFREEFEPPYDIGAEQMIADLDFLDDDPEDVTRAKFRLLHLYRWRIHEREARSEMLKKNKYGLLNVQEIMKIERASISNDKLADLRPFARFVGLDKIERLASGMEIERTLRKRIHELQEARASGCRTFGDIRIRNKDPKSPKISDRLPANAIGKWRRYHTEAVDASLSVRSTPTLTDREKAFCLDVGFSHWQFAVLKDRILREAEEHGGRFSKAFVRSFFRLDSTQAVKLFEFFVSEEKIVNADKDPKDPKKQQTTEGIKESQTTTDMPTTTGDNIQDLTKTV